MGGCIFWGWGSGGGVGRLIGVGSSGDWMEKIFRF